MKKEHIFFIFSSFDLGGIQRKIVDIVNYILGSNEYQNIEPHIVIRHKKKFEFDKYLNKNFKNLHYAPKTKKYLGNITYIFFLSQMLLRYKPKTVVCYLHYTLPHIFWLKKILFFLKFDVVIGQDNILSFDSRKPYVPVEFPKSVLKKLYEISKVIIVQTNYARQDLIKNFDFEEKKIKVIPNWLVKKNIPKFLDKKIKKYDLIYCGRFTKQKNLEKMIYLISKLKFDLPNIKLCLMGQGDQEDCLKKLVRKLKLKKNVIFKKPSYQVFQNLSLAKIFVLTSDYEGHPMILLEAMAVGLVPVVLNYPGVNEYLKNKRDGFIESDLSKMSLRILSLLNDDFLLNNMSLKAQKIVFSYYNENLIEETLSYIL